VAADADVAGAAAVVGLEILRSRYGGPLTRLDKGRGDFATEADLEAEEAVRRTINEYCPHDAFLGEESGASGSGLRTWLVDPLCGTRNFAARTPFACTNVALRVGDQLSVAAVADLSENALYWTDGIAAYTGDREPLTPSAASGLVDVDADRQPRWAASLASGLPGVLDGALGLRVSSTSLALAWVATGRRAAYAVTGDVQHSVHFAAGIALCRAAGCVVTDLRGEQVGPGNHGLLVAADQPTHAALLPLVRGH
jgi:myo-inositol-1(or 4)-monophosphatase